MLGNFLRESACKIRGAFREKPVRKLRNPPHEGTGGIFSNRFADQEVRERRFLAGDCELTKRREYLQHFLCVETWPCFEKWRRKVHFYARIIIFPESIALD